MSSDKPDLSSLRIPRTEEPRVGRGGAGRFVPWLFVVPAVLVAALWSWLAPRAVPVRAALASATGGGSVGGSGITANGYVVARTRASVSARIVGRLEYLRVSEGSRVRRGEILARIESGDYEAALNAARASVAQFEAQLRQARREVERAGALGQQQLVPVSQVEDAQTAVEVTSAQLASARAQAKLAEVNLENTRVRAPFDGTVLRKDAEVGEIVAPSSAGGGLTRTAIVTMANLATLEVEVDVNEAYIAQIRNGQRCRITLDAYPDTSFAGRVRQVVPTADRQKATVQVKVSILDRDARILPEMGAKVVFVPAGQEKLAAAPRRVIVPADAVVQGPGSARVWVIAGGRVAVREVDAGPAHDDHLEIRRGLNGGESVVLQPPANLKDGARVRLINS